MRRHSLTRIFVISLTVLFAIGAAAVAQESGATQPKKKKPTLTPEPATQTAPAQTQTAPTSGKSAAAKGKGNAAKDPKEAGWVTVHGRLLAVQTEQHAVIIQTDSKQYQIHVNAQTQITRDGRPADLNALRPNDRVDGCHFNAKHLAQSLKVTSAENALTARPNPSNQ